MINTYKVTVWATLTSQLTLFCGRSPLAQSVASVSDLFSWDPTRSWKLESTDEPCVWFGLAVQGFWEVKAV